MKKANIKLMYWYMKIGRLVCAALFTLAVIITFIQLVKRKEYLLEAIIFDVVFALVGIILESRLILYRHRGTIYVEIDKKEEKFSLIEYEEGHFVSEYVDDYVVKLPGETYSKSFKKSDVILLESPNIDRPFIEIVWSTKVSKPADNEYSIFASVGDKVKTENSKIIVKNKAKDICRLISSR